MGIDSVLFVSTEYKHSGAGINIDVAGASIEYQGKRYVFAEFTDQVALGLIDQTMSDPKGWIVIDLDE